MSIKLSAAKFLTDLPSDVLVQILARLPLKTIYVVRSVCKTFMFLTSTDNPHFIDLHSSNGAQIFVFQFKPGKYRSNLLRFADPELDYELKPLFQLPTESTNFEGKDRYDRSFLSNSCNGLLFFFRGGPPLVCNPVTNEYIIIPEVGLKTRLDWRGSMWLGFSPITNQYKVLRVSLCHGFEAEAEVFVIGSGSSWRVIDDTQPPKIIAWTFRPACVNGFIYWFCQDWTVIQSFDFETEKFGNVALPVECQQVEFRKKEFSTIGVLGGCLCLSHNYVFAERIDLWVMTNQDSWRKEFVICTVRVPRGLVRYGFRPMQILRNGKISMQFDGNNLVCYDPRTGSLRYFGLHGLELTYSFVALTPSFVPLKDTLKVENVLRA